MSLERRLSEALHSADGFQPSPDLFARTSTSIDEDQAHRRRLMVTALGIAALVGAASVLLGLVAQRGASGALTAPRWAYLAVQLEIQLALALALTPAIRRFGKPLLDDAFRLGPEVVTKFARLLDLAYYLFFGGLIVLGADVSNLDATAPMAAALEEVGARVGFFCAAMGVLHAVNLLFIPVVGLVYGSVARRARRTAAGATAAPVATSAERADRVAGLLGLALIVPGIVVVGLMIVAFVVGGLNP